ncbi:3-HAO-domain-containing protein [Delitschia confertaspora ATCC 74209]|uniref:3-hydroxyanthranilate 3,4-dioxygenase n=1 Tax=Delitschia confertaspora ATCC 74209 TaxID=1513339 RepID=A0A9P4JQW5_9PLEO|nr:3-HAO-domain-containing protein [Delitschia confertaspora ATCC 74209]
MQSLCSASRLLRHSSYTLSIRPVITPILPLRRQFTQTTTKRLLPDPINIPIWLNENSHLLQPPINNHCIYRTPTITVMLVGGPNARTDYHINSTPEYFYQYRGSMLLKIVDTDGSFRDITIGEGEMFLLPPNTPHNPVRFADTVGVVLELVRPEGSVDRLRWYCQECGEKVHEASFHCTDLGTQIKEAVNAFKDDKEARTCKKCGTLCDVAPKPK